MRGKCTSCSAVVKAEQVVRDYIGQNQVSTKISGIGTDFWVFVGGVVFGIVFINPILAVTKAGSKYLEDLAREKIKR